MYNFLVPKLELGNKKNKKLHVAFHMFFIALVIFVTDGKGRCPILRLLTTPESTTHKSRETLMATLFGPVPSRRLGRSLGIDVIAPKTCTYDCIYCESGSTTHLTLQKQSKVSVEKVLEDLDRFFEVHTGDIDALTFSSAGEPTLYRDLGSLINRIKEKYPDIPLVVLTNGSLLWDENVRKSLLAADRVVPSLDAVSDSIFRKINRPHPHLKIDTILDGIRRFRKEYRGGLHLEILLVAGMNDGPEELGRIAGVVESICPDRVELNTVVRPPAHEGTLGLDARQMAAAARFFPPGMTQIIGSYVRGAILEKDEDLDSRVIELLLRRPCAAREMASSLGVSPVELEEVLLRMRRQGRIEPRMFGQEEFFLTSSPA